MVDRNSALGFAALFEQRAHEIEAEKRRPPDGTSLESTSRQDEITYHLVEEDGKPSSIWEMHGRKLLRTIEPDSVEGKNIVAESLQPKGVKSKSIRSRKTRIPKNSSTEAFLSRAQELAAVSGRVSPGDLVPAKAGEDTRQQVLSRLAPQFGIETHESDVQWLLSREPRNTLLRRLKDKNRLVKILDGPLPPTDRFGWMLRLLLRRGPDLDLKSLAREDLQALAVAMETTADIGLPQPEVSVVRQLAGHEEFLSDYDVLLANGFVGRQKELEKLHKFVAKPNPASFSQLWSSLVLTGLGGAGKSTLLAQFARELFKKQLATIVILDFDRPGINASDTYWLEQEICRQVGQQYPETAEFLRRRRREERSYRGETIDSVKQSSSEAVDEARSSRSLIWSVRESLEDVKANSRPFLLVVDTFEQVDEQDISAKVFDWLHDISSSLSPISLKIIFSGRLYDSTRKLLEKQSKVQGIEVDELEPDYAKQLLLSYRIPSAIAQRLVDSNVLPLRPLELTLLAKITEDLDKTIDELEHELREGGDSAKELFGGLVYRRVLRRLGDPTAQQLAYPGLVLRYVTAELIQEVLVPALGLQPFDEAEATRALDVLASNSWLAYRRSNEVWHRSDLRRSTLKAMIAAEPKNAAKISAEAIKFFEKQSDDKSRAEAVYHRLMLMREPADGESFQLGELQKANEHIGVNSADLPPPAATLLKFAVKGKVPAAEVDCLPSRFLDSAYREAGKQLVESRQFGKALKLLDRRHAGTISTSALDEWEIDTLFATVSWERLESQKPDRQADGAKTTLKSILSTLYPIEIIQPSLVATYPLETTLADAVNDDKLLQRQLRGSDGHERIRQLAISLVYHSTDNPMAGEVKTSVERILRIWGDRGLAPVTERRLMLLQRLLPGGADDSEVAFTINTIRLDSGWIRSFKEYLDRLGEQSKAFELESLLGDVESVLRSSSEIGDAVRRNLGKIDALSKKQGQRRGTSLDLNSFNTSTEEALMYVRGPDPEFRDPCRFALLEAFPDRSSQRRLCEIIASLVDLPADDLRPDSFADALAADPEQALEVYVELIDRTWALGELLREAESKSSSTKLMKVSTAYKHWDDAFRAIIVKAFSPDAGSASKLTEQQTPGRSQINL